MSRPSVLFVGENGDSSCSYYRCILPAKGLHSLGWETFFTPYVYQIPDGRLAITMPVQGSLFDREPIVWIPDIVVCRRMNGPDGKFWSSAHCFKEARKHGQKIFIDLDDDPWTLPTWNPAYGSMSKHDLSLWRGDMEAANGVIVTTPALAASVQNHSNARVYVCRNSVDVTAYHNLWAERSNANHVRTRLGWLGTLEYRQKDLEVVVPALQKALIDYAGEVEFWHIGKQSNRSILSVLGDNFPVPVIENDWVPISQLPFALEEIDCAIVPMLDHPFNYARSNVTGLALMAAGVPFVASQTPEYLDLWNKGGGYVVPNDMETWEGAIRSLVSPETAGFRTDLTMSGLALVRHYTPEIVAERYVKAFTDE